MVTMSKEELKKHFDAVYLKYRNSPERARNVEILRRKHSVLTEKDLLKTFTV